MAESPDSEDDQNDRGWSWRDLPDFFGTVLAVIRAIRLLVRGLWFLAGLIAEAIRD